MHQSNVPKLSAGSNYRLLTGFVALGPKDHKLSIQPPGLGSMDEDLGSMCVWSSILYGQDARTRLLLEEVLTINYLLVDGVATRATLTCEVTTLECESGNASRKAGSLINKSFFFFSPVLRFFCYLPNLRTALRKYRPGRGSQLTAMSNVLKMTLAGSRMLPDHHI